MLQAGCCISLSVWISESVNTIVRENEMIVLIVEKGEGSGGLYATGDRDRARASFWGFPTFCLRNKNKLCAD